MTDRERLIGLLEEIDKHPDITCPSPKNVGACRICKHKINDVLCDAISREADYLLEHGVIVLPCKAGDTLYAESAIKGHIKSFEVPDLAWVVEYREFFGKEIFLTREEAEIALKERDGS